MARKKENILRKLKTLSPGSSAGISTVKDTETNEGNITSDPTEIANAPAKHWKKVF